LLFDKIESVNNIFYLLTLLGRKGSYENRKSSGKEREKETLIDSIKGTLIVTCNILIIYIFSLNFILKVNKIDINSLLFQF
jgi:hypothetical protein